MRSTVILKLALAALVISSVPANARDIFGIKKLGYEVPDHTIDRLNNSIQEARDAALALEARANADAKERIEQIDKLVQDALNRLDNTLENQNAIIQEYIAKFDNIRVDSFNRLTAIIDKLVCEVNRTFTERVREALGVFGDLIGSGDIEITAPVLHTGERTFYGRAVRKTFRVKRPFSATYEDIYQYLVVERLGKSRDDTPIASVLQTYLLMARLSEQAGCLVGDTKGYAVLYSEYWSKLRDWKTVFGEKVSLP